MSPDDPVCLCFQVSRRKVQSYIRIEKPLKASQLSNCFGAGTGCGWCRDYLERLFNEAQATPNVSTDQCPAKTTDSERPAFNSLTTEEYAQLREGYLDDQKND